MITTLCALSASAIANALFSQRTSAAVRASISACWCGFHGAVCVLAYQGSMSLFEPPGTLTVTNTVFDCSNMTFSTYWASAGNVGSNAVACEITCIGCWPSVQPGFAKKMERTTAS